jgi:hypothetical protein
VDTLFDERLSQSAPLPSSDVADTTSAYPHGSLFLSPELPLSTTQHHPGFVDGIHTSSQLSFSLPSDATTNSGPTPPPTTLLSPLLGLSSSKTLTEGLETSAQEQVVPKAKATTAVETLPNSTRIPAPTSVAEWRLQQSQLTPHPKPETVPQSPPGSVLSSASDFPLSSATSLQTGTWGFSP